MDQGLSEPEFNGDLVYKLKKIDGSHKFSAQLIKISSRYKKIGYNINVLQQTALGGQPNHGFPLLLHAGGSDFRHYDGFDLKNYLLIRW